MKYFLIVPFILILLSCKKHKDPEPPNVSDKIYTLEVIFPISKDTVFISIDADTFIAEGKSPGGGAGYCDITKKSVIKYYCIGIPEINVRDTSGVTGGAIRIHLVNPTSGILDLSPLP